MSSPGYLGEPGGGGIAPKFRWDCPHKNCKREIVAWSKNGLDRLAEMHLDEHYKEHRDRIAKIETALSVKKKPEEYQKLRVNWADIGFLKTRGIAIDEDVIYDKLQPYHAQWEEEVLNWRKLLEAAWPLNSDLKL